MLHSNCQNNKSDLYKTDSFKDINWKPSMHFELNQIQNPGFFLFTINDNLKSFVRPLSRLFKGMSPCISEMTGCFSVNKNGFLISKIETKLL